MPQVRGKKDNSELRELSGQLLPSEEGTVEVWDALVQILELPAGTQGSSGSSGKQWKYVPLNVKRTALYQSTFTMSSSAYTTLLLGAANSSVPLGYESSEAGLARHAGRAG